MKKSFAPRDTVDLRLGLQAFLDSEFETDEKKKLKIGNFQWGVYAFFDYDKEPIYVGQTNEKLRTRIRRHLTNQMTDAVAMSVLDPFEVLEIEVWPLPQFEGKPKNDPEAKQYLNNLESRIFRKAVEESRFSAILNEKDPPLPSDEVEIPRSSRGRIVSEELLVHRQHPDVRAARRAMIIARLAQVIAEREVTGGLRRAFQTQTERLNWLAKKRFEEAGGASSVERENDESEPD